MKKSGPEELVNLAHPELFREVLHMCLPSFSSTALDVIVHEYFCWDRPTDNDAGQLSLSKALGDYLFSSDSHLWMRILGSHAIPVFAFQFGHRTQNTPWPAWTGTKHGDELAYVFGDPLRQESIGSYSDEERSFARRIISLWTAFSNLR